MKQPPQKFVIEQLKLPFTPLLSHLVQLVAEIVGVAVQEALLLDEVHEHHAVEHQGSVPVPVALGRDALDEVSEGGQLRPEPVVEAPGDLFDVQGGRTRTREATRAMFSEGSSSRETNRG